MSFYIILVGPEKAENVGLVARNMKNTGFKNLRIAKRNSFNENSYITAVHSKEVLDNALFYPDVKSAIEDLDIVFATTSKWRKNFYVLNMKEALQKMFDFTDFTRIGILFGNERTGLTSNELMNSNFVFKIPQAVDQPSYNLSSAVLISLYSIFDYKEAYDYSGIQDRPVSRKEQEKCIQLILKKLEKKGFIHENNKIHITEMIYHLLGRLAMTSKDKDLLLAMFSKGLN